MKTRTPLRSRAVLVGLIAGVPLSVMFLWLAVRNADLGEVRSVLGDADLGFAVLAVAAMAGVYAGQAIRWRAIARTPSVRTRRFAEMVVSGVAVNNVLPGRVGDLLRARWLQVDARIPGGRSLATVIVDRAFDVLALVVFLAVSLPFVASAEWLYRIAIGGLALLLLLGLVLVAARIYASRRSRDRRPQRSLVRRIARDTVEGLADPIGRRRAAGLSGISLGTWAMWAVAAWLVGRAVGVELTPVEAVFVTAVINLGVAIPSSPGFIGTYQWLGVSALALFDVGTEQALAFSILMQAVWYVPTLLVGGVLLVRRGVRTVRGAPARRLPLGETGDA
jgi:glycosyltransferase 2 family protein